LQQRPKSKEVTLNYRLSRMVHAMAFTRDKALYPLLKRVFTRLDQRPGFFSRMAYRVERASKLAMYGCQDCGDCSLPDCAYLCPKKYCSKCGRNGPCGGSAGGRCELDDKECFWARIYERLKRYGESETMLERPVTIYNATLKDTSSWVNTFLDRDHHAPPPPTTPVVGSAEKK
jgi:methylenetetrahydrofolate reductase (NADPH)